MSIDHLCDQRDAGFYPAVCASHVASAREGAENLDDAVSRLQLMLHVVPTSKFCACAQVWHATNRPQAIFARTLHVIADCVNHGLHEYGLMARTPKTDDQAALRQWLADALAQTGAEKQTVSAAIGKHASTVGKILAKKRRFQIGEPEKISELLRVPLPGLRQAALSPLVHNVAIRGIIMDAWSSSAWAGAPAADSGSIDRCAAVQDGRFPARLQQAWTMENSIGGIGRPTRTVVYGVPWEQYRRSALPDDLAVLRLQRDDLESFALATFDGSDWAVLSGAGTGEPYALVIAIQHIY